MNNPTILKAHSKDGFQFTFQIEKSLVKAEDNDLILSGVASTTNVDHDNERMDNSALKRMVNIVNTQGVPLRWEHSKDPSAVLGTVYKGHVDERGNMTINARLDKNHPLAVELYEAVKKGERYGLSVGGKILNAVKEMAEGAGKYVKTFYDVLLDEVSVTKKPANYDAWLTTALTKNQNADKSYSRFLFENQQFDYLAQMAKSIPTTAWEKVTKLQVNNKKNMKDEKEVKDEAEKSYVSKAQFEKFSADVTKAISGLTGLLKSGVEVDALDAANPDKKKEYAENQQVAKDAADGDDGKPASDVPANDQEAPSKSKEKEVGDEQTAKEEEGEKKDDAEKAEDDEEKKDDAEKADDGEEKKDEAEKAEDTEDKDVEEKSEDGEKLPKDLKNAMKSIGDAIGVIEGLTKKMKGIKKIAKSEKVEKSQVSEIDRFAVSVAEYVDGLEARLEKSHKSIPGYRQALADQIKNDPILQAEIRKMMKEPGMKKSVAFGVPYMTTKDGKRFSLTATPVGEKVEKSQYNKDVDFKTLYKSKYSAIREATE